LLQKGRRICGGKSRSHRISQIIRPGFKKAAAFAAENPLQKKPLDVAHQASKRPPHLRRKIPQFRQAKRQPPPCFKKAAAFAAENRYFYVNEQLLHSDCFKKAAAFAAENHITMVRAIERPSQLQKGRRICGGKSCFGSQAFARYLRFKKAAAFAAENL